MNCANHPDLPVAAYCQNCGKPLCSQCVRSISGVIYCEQCLAAKLGVPGATPNAAPGAPVVPLDSDGPNPALAFALGFIPGVGAMYNGQFIKALIHVLVFVVLIGITGEHPLFGIFIAAWIFYQVFDAFQTAQARRNGLPLPDPFGLNELGQRLGIPNRSYGMPVMGTIPTQGQYQAPPVPPPPSYGQPYGADPYAPVPPVPPVPPMPPDVPGRRPEPIGAIVLIAVGMLFLFSTLGFLRFDWIGRGWPILVIGIGVWLLVRRTREVPPPPAPPTGGGQ